MKSLVFKSLCRRDEAFSLNNCPSWLVSLLPEECSPLRRDDSSIEIESPKEEDPNEIDLSSFRLVSHIPLLKNDSTSTKIEQIEQNEELFDNDDHFEYPHNSSFIDLL